MKETLMQYFEWYLPDDGNLWTQISANVDKIAANGVTMMWLPPAYKGQAGKEDVGYGVYDHYDLGEFLSKGNIDTKYGSKEEYIQCIEDLQSHDIAALGDIVLNHMMGSDEAENVKVQNVNENNRDQETSGLYDAKVWTKFTFPERKGKYSDFVWDWHSFSGTDYNASNNQNGILKFEGKDWSDHVSDERGNFDYIMGADVDFSVPWVVEELYRWGIWYTETTGVNGFRLDAVKSIDARFFRGWLIKMHEYGNHLSFAVGEYWTDTTGILRDYLKDCGHCMTLFDVPLHYHFQQASNQADSYDLRGLFSDTITRDEPDYSVPFVDNHDTQPGQALESWVQEWFKPLAYALILLRDAKFPCVFYGDYYGIEHNQIGPVANLDKMIWIRRNLLGDGVVDYSDQDPHMLCWLVNGKHPVVVILSSADWKECEVRDLSLAGQVMVDINAPEHTITCDDEGKAVFSCLGRNVSVYILQDDWKQLDAALPSFQH